MRSDYINKKITIHHVIQTIKLFLFLQFGKNIADAIDAKRYSDKKQVSLPGFCYLINGHLPLLKVPHCLVHENRFLKNLR